MKTERGIEVHYPEYFTSKLPQYPEVTDKVEKHRREKQKILLDNKSRSR